MSIIYKDKVENYDELKSLYDNAYNAPQAFKNSKYTKYAYDDKKLIGAVRIISEGVETALLVDTKLLDGYDKIIKFNLIKEIEKKLIGKRVMIYGDAESINFYEELGYHRCKNAWTYFGKNYSNVSSKLFLPEGYKFENEFKVDSKEKKEPVKAVITYNDNFNDGMYEINELLTKAFFGRPHDIEKTTEAFENSQYMITAYHDDKIVGVARAVSDGVKYATILNVAVDPEYQGLSIGKEIVIRLSEKIKEDIIVLNTHAGSAGFYNKLKEYRRNKTVFEKNIDQGKRTMDPLSYSLMFTPKGYKFLDEY